MKPPLGYPLPTCPDARCSRGRLWLQASSQRPDPPAPKRRGKQIKLAYCSQLLCGVPYEVARSAGYFKAHGLEVQLVYTRGGNAAMQALVGGAVEDAATALDVALQAYANVGAAFAALRSPAASPVRRRYRFEDREPDPVIKDSKREGYGRHLRAW